MIDKTMCRFYRWSPVAYNYYGLIAQIVVFPVLLLILVMTGLLYGLLRVGTHSGFYFDDLRRDFQRIRQGHLVYKPRCPDTD